jgi:hypothetical protein
VLPGTSRNSVSTGSLPVALLRYTRRIWRTHRNLIALSRCLFERTYRSLGSSRFVEQRLPLIFARSLISGIGMPRSIRASFPLRSREDVL